MILIADSGSTKCSWALCDEQGNTILKYKTIGFNPYFIDKESILHHLRNSGLEKCKEKVDTVFFYGAGCSSEDKNKIIKEALNVFFKNTKIIIKHDIDAACYAMYNGKPNITCILGTGSNSCYYDQENIIENAPSLGFLIGDEASGNYFGKKILTLYFNKSLPNDLVEKFESNYETDWSIIKENIYGNERPNVYLAKFFPFVSDNKDHPIIKDMIYKGLEKFFSLHIFCYKKYKEVEINFIGSVAYYLSNEIRFIAKKNGCKIGNIVQNPINKLVDFHFNVR
ncbi:MAG: ATPase [Bacteroidota bacterium]|nr:ATPase [Bacteroidota bacterium]